MEVHAFLAHVLVQNFPVKAHFVCTPQIAQQGVVSSPAKSENPQIHVVVVAPSS